MDAYGIEPAWRDAVAFVEQNGWRILGFAVFFYVLRQKYSAYATRAHVERTLAEANDPQRVAVLQREAARVRQEQQQRLQETLPTRKPTTKKPPATSTSIQDLKKQT